MSFKQQFAITGQQLQRMFERLGKFRGYGRSFDVFPDFDCVRMSSLPAYACQYAEILDIITEMESLLIIEKSDVRENRIAELDSELNTVYNHIVYNNDFEYN